jgi:hypothetical protein
MVARGYTNCVARIEPFAEYGFELILQGAFMLIIKDREFIRLTRRDRSYRKTVADTLLYRQVIL